MSNIFFTSDTHIGHVNIIKYCSRPFGNVEDMREGLIERWNSVVKKEDIVYHLGDFSLQPRHVEGVLSRLNRRELHLYLGNHDKPFHGEKKWLDQYKAWGFTTIQWTGRFSHDSLKLPYVNLCHLPYRGAGDAGGYEKGDEERYPDFRLEDDGEWLFHGHSHNPSEKRVRHKMIDVGVDANDYTPVSIEQLKEYMK